MYLDLPPMLIAALAVLCWLGASARLTRLITQDSFPPVVWLRMKWDARTEDTPWNPLAHCHWCLAPWTVAVIGVWGYFTGPHWTWWAFTAWLTGAYLASWLVHHDED